MSKLQKPRAWSWAALHDEIAALDAAADGTEAVRITSWARDYLDALQVAIEGRDPAALLAMLDAGVPMHERLLPVLADALRSGTQGLASGRPAMLTRAADETIRHLYERATGPTVSKPMGRLAARKWLAEAFGVSETSVRAALTRTKPG